MRFSRVTLEVRSERYPIRGAFTISRGSKREAEVVVVELSARLQDGREVGGRGECVPYSRYGETVAGVVAAIETQRAALEIGLSREDLQTAMQAGAARNALDCAFWDLEAKATSTPAWRLAGLAEAPGALTTAYTLSLDTIEAMGEAARGHADYPLLKLKLGGGDEDIARVAAVRRAAPNAKLIVDANEGWTIDQLAALAPRLAELGVTLIEQPLPAGKDDALAGFRSPVPIGADESCHDRTSLEALCRRYQAVNIKLDKTGGLTEALRLKEAAEAAGFEIMVGCMVATSLAMAPAMLVAQGAEYVDLDGPLLLARDREPGLSYTGACIEPPETILWG